MTHRTYVKRVMPTDERAEAMRLAAIREAEGYEAFRLSAHDIIMKRLEEVLPIKSMSVPLADNLVDDMFELVLTMEDEQYTCHSCGCVIDSNCDACNE